ncbi:MAG: RT0821/Lpp0805 family surface protein [Pseudomonadota bacterium]
MRNLFDNNHRDRVEVRFVVTRCVITLVCGLSLGACAVSGNAIDNAGFTTNSLSMAEATPTIATNPFEAREGETEADTDRLLDEDTLRLAVTTLDVKSIPIEGARWANAATGTNGRITNVSERIIADQNCRTFDATRRSYDGISKYSGEVCLDPRSGWWTRSLTNLNSVEQNG